MASPSNVAQAYRLTLVTSRPTRNWESPPPRALFSARILLRLRWKRMDGPYRHLDLACAPALIDRLREAMPNIRAALRWKFAAWSLVMRPMARRCKKAHVAFLPLGFVGHPHANGQMPGVALALPNETPGSIRSDVLRATAAVCKEGLKLGLPRRVEAFRFDNGSSPRNTPLRNLDGVFRRCNAVEQRYAHCL